MNGTSVGGGNPGVRVVRRARAQTCPVVGLVAVATVAAGLVAPTAHAARAEAASPRDAAVVIAGSGTFASEVTVSAFVVGSPNGPAQGVARLSTGFLLRVDCLRLEGARALAGGTIISSSFPGQLGRRAAFVLDDVGSSFFRAPYDRIIVLVASADVPNEHFCNRDPSDPFFSFIFAPLTSGNFIIARIGPIE